MATTLLKTFSHRLVPSSSVVQGPVKPGFGFSELHIGMTEAEILDRLGRPDQKKTYGDEKFLIYKTLGIDIGFDKESPKARRLFFYRRGAQGHIGNVQVSYQTLTLSRTEDDVRAILGKPDDEGIVRTRKGLKRWLLFNSGIQFDVDETGKLEVIIVFKS